jgi:hypothetical protein
MFNFVFVYECDTVGGYHKLRAIQNEVDTSRSMFWTTGEEMTGGQRKLRNGEFHVFYFS